MRSDIDSGGSEQDLGRVEGRNEDGTACAEEWGRTAQPRHPIGIFPAEEYVTVQIDVRSRTGLDFRSPKVDSKEVTVGVKRPRLGGCWSKIEVTQRLEWYEWYGMTMDPKAAEIKVASIYQKTPTT